MSQFKQKAHLEPKVVKPETPVWKGPAEDGITQSLLGRYLNCKERFRLLVVEGLKVKDRFEHRLEFGNMWHTCEEFHGRGQDWEVGLLGYCRELIARYPLASEEISKWYHVCLTEFPIYVEFWANHPDVISRSNLVTEYKFDVDYHLPSGRYVKLRGKWDSLDIVGGGIRLQENKTKSEILEAQMKSQLRFDLQTMMYLIALDIDQDYNPIIPGDRSITGVIYNVVRRPLSGGKGSIVRYKPTKTRPSGETQAEFDARLAAVIQESPQDFFMRWNVDIHKVDLELFRQQCLDPILDNLCDDWEWWVYCHKNPKVSVYNYMLRAKKFPSHRCRHYRHPWGVYNVLNEGGSDDLDEYLLTGRETGLMRTSNLFPELT